MSNCVDLRRIPLANDQVHWRGHPIPQGREIYWPAKLQLVSQELSGMKLVTKINPVTRA